MLEAMTPAEFDERWAADTFDPIDDTWTQFGTLAAVIWNKLEEMHAALTRRAPKWKAVDQFVPKVELDKPTAAKPAYDMESTWKELARGRNR